MGGLRSVCVYCGSNAGSRPVYAERAAALGTRLAREGLGLVYGGGNVGLMGIVADATLAAGGEVVGVIPEQLVGWEVAHRGVTRLEVVANMHERKARMFDLSDAFVALPGGFGTLDEMFEMLTWRQLGLGDKPCAFLDVDDFYDPLVAIFSKKTWDELTETERKIIKDAATEAQAYERKVSREMDVTSRAALAKAGMQINEVAPEEIQRMRDHLKPVTEKFTEEYGAELVGQFMEEINKVRNAR